MELAVLVEEAAKALRLPDELRPITRNISYNQEKEEWYSPGDEYLELFLASRPYEWILRITGWLQYSYPKGPALSPTIPEKWRC